MITEQQEVQDWLDSGRDYRQGVMLFARFSKNKVLVHTLMKPGKERFGGQAKLEYELPKAVGMVAGQLKIRNEKLKIEGNSPKTNSLPSALSSLPYDDHVPLITNTPASAYPKAIRRLKLEYGELYNKRAMLHRQMREVPAENSPANMEKRAELLEEIKGISDRMETLYASEEKWVRLGTIPDEKELWPDAPPIAIGAVTNELPDDIESLKKLKKNLQTNNVKDRNQLQFQSRTKSDEAQPMPDGPKRKLIEKQIKSREELIVKVDLKLQECYLNHQK